MMTKDDENQRVGSEPVKVAGKSFRIWLTGDRLLASSQTPFAAIDQVLERGQLQTQHHDEE